MNRKAYNILLTVSTSFLVTALLFFISDQNIRGFVFLILGLAIKLGVGCYEAGFEKGCYLRIRMEEMFEKAMEQDDEESEIND